MMVTVTRICRTLRGIPGLGEDNSTLSLGPAMDISHEQGETSR